MVNVVRSYRTLIVSLVSAVLLASGLSASASATGTHRRCAVTNVTRGTWFATYSGFALTRAIAQAHEGDELHVFGTCVGGYVIDKDLTIAGHRSLRSPTVLSGGGKDRVLTVEFADVRLRDLVVTRGSSTVGGGGGLAVFEGSSATLRRVNVIGNHNALVGGGIVNGGDLRLYDSWVIGKSVDSDGGGIYNYGDVLLENVSVNRNVAAGVGGGLFNEGSAVVNRSRIRFNVADFGGGILNVSLLTLTDSVVSDNTPDDCAC
jgi:nitrous oxidase accessory protein NosD